jgi:hypothetical protein
VSFEYAVAFVDDLPVALLTVLVAEAGFFAGRPTFEGRAALTNGAMYSS